MGIARATFVAPQTTWVGMNGRQVHRRPHPDEIIPTRSPVTP
ncbi:hypothetical protein [Edwardsiella tarda]